MNNTPNVCYAVYEGSQVRHERTVKRLIAVIIVLIVLLFASHMAWLYAWQSYDYTNEETQEITVDGKDGIANYIGNDGDIINGEDYGYKTKTANTP